MSAPKGNSAGQPAKLPRKRRSRKTGLPPGTLLHVGVEKAEKPVITIFYYTPSEIEEKRIENIAEFISYKERPGITWIDIDGVHDPKIIEALGKHYDLHPLTLEDILNTEQRPKREDFGKYLYMVVRMLHRGKNNRDVINEQLSIILGDRFLITFQEQEREGDVFEFVRQRIRNSTSRLRQSGADYLCYALIDSVVDHYFVILEQIGEEIEALEGRLVAHAEARDLPTLYSLKRRMLAFRRSVWPLREMLAGIERGESTLIKGATGIFFRDIYDHTIQVMDSIETYREMLSSMLDIYLSSLSNRMNSVMKVLTLISTIFLPLTFIVGIYGMNFDYMPELRVRWGYGAVWLVMVTVAFGMIYFFRRKRWI